MLEPVFVIAVRVVLAGVGAAALLAGRGRGQRGHGLAQQVFELQRFDQIGVPDQRAVGDFHRGEALQRIAQPGHAFSQHFAGAEHGGVVLHEPLHFQADLRGGTRPVGVANPVHMGDRLVAGSGRQRRRRAFAAQRLGAATRGGAAEHHKVQQRIRAQAVGAVHRYAGRLAHRQQSRRDVVPVLEGLAVIVGGNAAHVVVHRGHDRQRLPGDVHVGEHPGGLGDARQPLGDHLGIEVHDVQVHVVLARAQSPALAQFDRDGAADHVARGEVFGRRRVAFHEALVLGIGQVAALAAHALGNQAARAQDAGGMELHEFHVHQRQPGSQRHAVAVAGAGVRRSAGVIRPAVPAGGENYAVGVEAVQVAGLQVHGHYAPAHAVDHDEVDRKVLDEKLRFMAQGLLVQRVQHGVAGAVGGRAGAHCLALAEMRGHAAEGALVDAPVLGARKRQSVVLQLNDRPRRFLAHVFDGVLVAQPVRPLHRVVHVPAPVVLAHVAQRRADAALGRHRVAAGGKDLGDAGRIQPGFGQPEGGPQAGAAGAHDHDVEGVIDYGVIAWHFRAPSSFRSG